MSSKWNFIRSLLYPLSRIPGLGFLYQADRWLSRGESVRSSVRSYQAERDVERDRDQRQQGQGSASEGEYMQQVNGIIAPFKQMHKNASEMSPDAAETRRMFEIVSDMDALVQEYRPDSEGFMAAMEDKGYAQEMPQLMNAIQGNSVNSGGKEE